MRRLFRRIGVGVFLALFVVAVPSTLALGGVTLRVWDNGSAPDDQADVYFDGQLLGRSAPTPTGTTWDLGDLTVGSHTLKLIHQVDIYPPGTYSWELSGGGLSANDDTAQVKSGGAVTINVLANDAMTDVSEGATPRLNLGESYETTIVVEDASNLLEINNVTHPAQGSVEISPDKKYVVYTADAGACGVDTFEYEAIDPSDPSKNDTATVTVTVEDTTHKSITSIPYRWKLEL